MIDVNDLRTRPDIYRLSQEARGEDPAAVDAVLHADTERRQALLAFEELRARQNAFGKKVAAATGNAKQQLIAEAQELAERVKKAQSESEKAHKKQEKLAASISNLIIEEVPHGGESDYAVLKTVGRPRDFAAEGFEPRDHLDIGERIGAIDMERGAKVSGTRFYFLTGVGARLELALLQLAFDQAIGHGFIPMITPTLVRTEIMEGTGFATAHDDEIYRLEQDRLYLTGTSEVALAGYHAGEILDLSSGPRRYVGWSSCYRREAGSHGKDTRGIIRVHQFNKVEMFSYATAEEAEGEHLRLLQWEEDMLNKAELSYRIIDTAAGDLGMSAARKYDSEAWIPSQNTYRELTSASNCTTFQARRLKIRERLSDAKSSGTQNVATLNGTLATTRWLVAILEQHQNPDGSVHVPLALRPYLGGMETLSARN